MARLIAKEGALKDLVLSLTDKEEWVIGRDPDHSDLLVEDPKVSRAHIRCRKGAIGFIVENLSTTNPALLNDLPLTEPTVLHDQDRLTLGSTQFVFHEDTSTPEGESILREEDLGEIPAVHFDLSQSSRFLLKVLSGPNSGAEFALDLDRDYLIGTDVASCDIVFHDLSVSREHAKLFIGPEGVLFIEDLGSRNGVLIDRARIVEKRRFLPNHLVTLGTTSFLIIDREAPRETLVASLEPERLEPTTKEEAAALPAEAAEAAAVAPQKAAKPLPIGALILSLILGGLALLFGIGVVSLFQEEQVVSTPRDYLQEIQLAVKPFPAVKFSYNKATGRLFLAGHVSNGVEKSELLYNLQGLLFLRGIEDNVVVDDAIWQEMNNLLADHPEFAGVSMSSPEPGKFVVQGYLKTGKQVAALTEFLNLNFAFLDRLDNEVIVEEQVLNEVTSRLMQYGLNGVTVTFVGGELILTGYISSAKQVEYQIVLASLPAIHGVRVLRDFVVSLAPEQGVVDLNERYPGRYQVTGYSKHGNINVNVVINGRILLRGDQLDGMTITSIQPHAIFLEKDGLKYKIEYNK